MKMDDSVREKLLKLKALADNGRGGEKVNAARLLLKNLNRLGYTMDDLEDTEMVRVKFPFNNKNERQLLFQIMLRAVPEYEGHYFKAPGKKHIIVDLPADKVGQIRQEYVIYKRDLKKALSSAFSAFIQANGIFGIPDPDRVQPELSPEDIEEIERIIAMAEGVTPSLAHKALKSVELIDE